MSPIWICFVAVLAFTASVPVSTPSEKALQKLFSERNAFGRNSALENIVIDVLEDLREIMVTGNDDIPVLDPFQLDHLHLDDSVIPVPGAHLELVDLTASKLSTFELNTVSISTASILLQRYRAIVDAEVPALEVDVGKYDLFVGLDGLNIFGTGDAKFLIIKPKIHVNLLVGIRLGFGAIYLNILNTRIEFSLTDVQSSVTGMFHDPSVEGFVNAFIRNLVLESLEAYSDDLTATVSPIVQNLANDLLSDLNLISLLG